MPKPVQYSGFQALHHSRLVVILVIIAEKMQKTVNNQMGKVVGHRQAPAVGLAPQRSRGQHDIAERRPETAGISGAAGNDRTLVGLSLPR